MPGNRAVIRSEAVRTRLKGDGSRGQVKCGGLLSASAWLGVSVCLCVGLMMVVLTSCTAGRSTEVVCPVDLPSRFSAEGQADMPEQWWTAFGDGQLDELVAEALRGNFSLASVWDRLAQAQAVAVQRGAALWPSVDGSAGYWRGVTKSAGADRTYRTEYSLGLSAGYEVDLWGRVRSRQDAARLDSAASEQDLHAAALTLTGQVAQVWFQLIEQGGQLGLLDEQIKTNQKYLEVITYRFRRGQVSATDVLQQRQLVESTRGERVLVEANIAALRHQLAVLLGRVPGGEQIEVAEKLPSMPALPSTGVPADWLTRRPDVRAAELSVQAADRRVAEALADQLPRLGLTITAETTAEQVRDLFDNWMANLLANLVAPLFDAGHRRAEVDRTRAVLAERVNTYGQTVLTAIMEVEDALSGEGKQAEYLESLSDQLELARLSAEQTRENYTKGTVDFTRYLTALLSYQSLQRLHLAAQRDAVLYRIDLYRALAGSCRLPRPRGAQEVEPAKYEQGGAEEHNGAALAKVSERS